METIIAYFKVNTSRKDLENELMNATFETMDAFLGLCEDEGWELIEWNTLFEHCCELNDEYYPTDYWVVYVHIKNLGK